MGLLTLTTDWGLRDHYVAAFKGELICLYPEVRCIDITHDIEHFNILQASFILRSAFPRFPAGTVHFIGLTGSDPNKETRQADVLIVNSQEHIFVGQDSGIFSLLLGESPLEIIRLSVDPENTQADYSKKIMETLVALVNGTSPLVLGEKQTTIHQSYLAQPTVDSDSIRGTILYIDSFGNVIVNVSLTKFEQERKSRSFTIFLRKSVYDIKKISRHYHEAEIGEIVALFNREGFLEIAINHDSAAHLLGLKIMDPIRIEFYDS